jgi:hypothetical protein
MRSSLLRRAKRQSGWRRTATVAADRFVVPDPVRPTAQLVPAETGSAGFAVETHVLARLLGIKLLTLEGIVLVSPAQVSRGDVNDPAAQQPPPRPTNGVPQRTSRSHVERTELSAGASLGDAARLLDECTEELRTLDADHRPMH